MKKSIIAKPFFLMPALLLVSLGSFSSNINIKDPPRFSSKLNVNDNYVKFSLIDGYNTDSSGLYLNADYNSIFLSGWDESEYYTGGSCEVGDENGKIFASVKLAESLFYVNVVDNNTISTSSSNVPIYYSGTLKSNNESRPSYEVAPFRLSLSYENEKYNYVDTTKEVSITSNNQGVTIDEENKIIYVSPETPTSALEITSNANGSKSIDFGSSIDSSNKFIKQDYDTFSEYLITAKAYDDGYLFKQPYVLRVGYKSIQMKAGAKIYDTKNSGTIESICSVPSSFADSFPNATYGMLFVKKKEIKEGYEFNSYNVFNQIGYSFDEKTKGDNTFVFNQTNLEKEINGDNVEYKGRFIGITPSEYNDEYISVLYVKNGDDYFFADYAEGNIDKNTISCSYIAQKAKENGDDRFSSYLTSTKTSYTINCYDSDLGKSLIQTITYEANLGEEKAVTAPDIPHYELVSSNSIAKTIYGSNNVFEFTYKKNFDQYPSAIYAWDTPPLDPSNNYDNEYNQKITSQLKEAGINAVLVYGNFASDIFNQKTIDAYKHLINGYYKYDIRTIIGGNSSFKTNRRHLDENIAPDWSDCPGFYGFLEWDEPQVPDLATITKYAKAFDKTYGDSNAKYLINLHPSYTTQANIYGSGSNSVISRSAYTSYLQKVCESLYSKDNETILNNSHRYFSIDSYPIDNKNGSLSLKDEFVFDCASGAMYGKSQNATTMICLQSSAFDDSSDHSSQTEKHRIPSETEMKIQTSVALSTGYDDISWFTYCASSSHGQSKENGYAIADYKGNILNQDLYNSLKETNSSFIKQKDLLKGYTYQGVRYNKLSILDDINGWNKYCNKISTSLDGDTFSIDSSLISTKDLLFGIYQNEEGSQAFAISNYNDSNSTSKFSLTVKEDMDIYANGVLSSTIKANTKTSISISPGTCLIIKK